MTAPSERKLSYKEYVARAMLIPDAGYVPIRHIMAIRDTNGMVRYLDPDTLGELSREDVTRRVEAGEKHREDIVAWVNAETEPMPLEEHKARAVLLGMFYGDKAHAYFPEDRSSKVRLDADTLEPITRAEVHRRMEAYYTLVSNLGKIRSGLL